MIAGICLCKDEADIIGPVVEHMKTQVDHVIVADNGSTDGTLDLLYSISDIEVLEDPDPAYYQSKKMSALAQLASDVGATWVVPFDSDEWWESSPGGSIADVLKQLESSYTIVEAEILNYVATGMDPHDDNPCKRMVWRYRQPLGLPKVACRVAPDLLIHQGNHGAEYEQGLLARTIARDMLTVRHFPYRSAQQFARKSINGASAYAATDLPRSVGAHWRLYGELYESGGEAALEDHFRKHFWICDPVSDNSVVCDPVNPGGLTEW